MPHSALDKGGAGGRAVDTQNGGRGKGGGRGHPRGQPYSARGGRGGRGGGNLSKKAAQVHNRGRFKLVTNRSCPVLSCCCLLRCHFLFGKCGGLRERRVHGGETNGGRIVYHARQFIVWMLFVAWVCGVNFFVCCKTSADPPPTS